MFSTAMTCFGCNVLNVNLLKCVSMNNQECKIRKKIIDINNNEPSFYPYSIEVNKCSGRCNNIYDPFAKCCVPDVVKNINVNVFNLMSSTNETRHIERHETCKCKCSLDAIVCNNKQRWNNEKCICECEELIDKGRCDKELIWNPSNCDCECDKSCDTGQYLDYKNDKCRTKLVDKLVDKCSENINGNEIIYNETLNDYEKVCNSCIIYIVLFVIAFLIIIGISSAYFYIHLYLERSETSVKTEALVY